MDVSHEGIEEMAMGWPMEIDRFVMVFPLASGMRDFGARIVPEQQNCGLFRTGYKGMALREQMGLERFLSAARTQASREE